MSRDTKCRELTELIDPNLRYIDSFHGNTIICLVEGSEGLSILKIGLSHYYLNEIISMPLEDALGGWELHHVRNERKILQTLADIVGIPRLYHSYEKRYSSNYSIPAILKEYIEGEPLTLEHVKSKELQQNIKDMMSNIWERKVRLWDVGLGHNILVRKGKPCIFDFGLAEQYSPSEDTSYSPEEQLKRFQAGLREERMEFGNLFFPDIKEE